MVTILQAVAWIQGLVTKLNQFSRDHNQSLRMCGDHCRWCQAWWHGVTIWNIYTLYSSLIQCHPVSLSTLKHTAPEMKPCQSLDITYPYIAEGRRISISNKDFGSWRQGCSGKIQPRKTFPVLTGLTHPHKPGMWVLLGFSSFWVEVQMIFEIFILLVNENY